MKKIVFTVFTVIVLLFAFGAQAADLKIGYVDLNKALNESEAGKKAVKNLEEIFRAKQSVVEERQKEIRKLDEELAKQASILNPDSLKEKREEFEKLKRDFQRMIKDSEDEVEKKRTDFMDRIIKDLAELIRKTGEEEGYTMILEKAQSGVLYSPEKLDLTDKIIKKYNEASKSEKKQ
jgi:outer membrane protein